MANALKDRFFTLEFIESLSTAIQKVYRDFDRSAFAALVLDETWETIELKQRMRHVTHALHATLPDDYAVSLDILQQVAPEFSGFDAMVFPDFVECYGQEDWDRSMPALGYFTPLCSSEFAVRPFLAADAPRALAYLMEWAESEDEHLRRLASEGCRPRLPWAMALPTFKADPRPILPILKKLKDDPSDYVRRSVANNLNDISKDNPELVLDLCESWHGKSARTNWIVKHGCRTLLKAGNTRALALFGFGDPKHMTIRALSIDNGYPRIGEEIRFRFELWLETERPERVRLEYAVYYVKARGNLSRKIFQIREATYEPGDHQIERKHSFVERSTRKHYPGDHRLAIIVNGVEKAKITFTLGPAQSDDDQGSDNI